MFGLPIQHHSTSLIMFGLPIQYITTLVLFDSERMLPFHVHDVLSDSCGECHTGMPLKRQATGRAFLFAEGEQARGQAQGQ